MISILYSMLALFVGIGIFVVGSGLLGTAVALRANAAGFSDTVTGLVMSAYFAGFVVGTYFCPHLVRRVGHVRTFAAVAATGSVTVLAHAMIIAPGVWVLLRFVTGICVVGLYMVIESWLNEKATNESRGRIFALYQGISLTGFAAGQYLILVGDFASPMPFMLAAGLISLGLVPIALTRVPEPPPIPTVRLELGVLWSTSPLGTMGALVAAVANGTFFALGPVFALHIGLEPEALATFMSVVILGGVLLQWPAGHLSDLWDRRSVILLVSLIGAGLAGVAAFFAERSILVLIVVAFLYGGATFTLYPMSVAHANDHTPSERLVQTASGLLLIYGIGATVGPALAGPAMDAFGASSFFLVLLGSQALLAVFALYRMRVRPAPPPEAQEPFVAFTQTSQCALEMLPPAIEDAKPER